VITMAVAMSPWLEYFVEAAPLLYGLGFFAVDVPIAWGLAGIASGMFLGSVGYGVMQLDAYGVMSLHMLTWAIIGSVLSYGSHYKRLLGWNRTGVQPTEVTPVAAQGQPGAPSHPNNCVFVGTVHDARSKSDVIEGAKVGIVGQAGSETTTDKDGRYRLELPDEAWLWKAKVSLEADHPSYHYSKHSAEIKVEKGAQKRIDFPMDRLVGPRAALGNVKITFADENGNRAPNIVRPGGWWGCHIEAFAPVTFDKPSGRHVPTGGEDRFELIDENTNPGSLIMELTESTPRSQGEIRYMSQTHVFVRARVPSRYADGTPIPMNADLKTKLATHLNVT